MWQLRRVFSAKKTMTPTMTALPAELPSRLSNYAAILGAYLICLEFEKSAQAHTNPKRLIYAKILGHLILEGPSDQARVLLLQMKSSPVRMKMPSKLTERYTTIIICVHVSFSY